MKHKRLVRPRCFVLLVVGLTKTSIRWFRPDLIDSTGVRCAEPSKGGPYFIPSQFAPFFKAEDTLDSPLQRELDPTRSLVHIVVHRMRRRARSAEKLNQMTRLNSKTRTDEVAVEECL